MNATPLAPLALLGWPAASLLLFTRFRPEVATPLAILLGELLLPQLYAFDPTGIPPLDRASIPCLSALLGCALFGRERLRTALPGTGIEALVAALVVGAFLTALANRDPVQVGSVIVTGMSLYDGLSAAGAIVLTMWIPFFLGRSLYRNPSDLVALLTVVAASMLAYSPLVLYELRMSPQLHRLVYGFHQHDFVQTFRWGGWRPMVFMTHGLTLAQFELFGAVAAIGLWRARCTVIGLPSGAVGLFLSALLAALKSLGAVLYGALVLPLIALIRPSSQLRLASLLAALTLSYPALRALDRFPTEPLLGAVSHVSAERRQSLEFRFEHEELLLDRAFQRFWLGWGLFGRHRVRDPMTGEDTSVTDGYWLISLGSQGILGLGVTFGLLVAPVWLAAASIRRWRTPRDRLLVALVAWMGTISAVNLLPNADYSPFILLLAGALTGVCEGVRSRPRQRRRRDLPK